MIPDWTVPFELRSSVFAGAVTLPFNTQTARGIYLLRPDGCSLENVVRLTKEYAPQQDGAILHRRFVGGMQMNLAVQLWENERDVACGDLLQEMSDNLGGYLYGLLNAGDNEGRIVWSPAGGSSVSSTRRMLDDIRLFTYPVPITNPDTAVEIPVAFDCSLPYAEDETQLGPSIPGAVVNNGNRPTYPVWKLFGAFSSVTMTATFPDTTTAEWTYDGTLPGASTIGGGDYIEIDTFRNTLYKNGAGANLKPGMVMTSSKFFTLPPGSTTIGVTYSGGAGGASVGLINAAFV